MNIIIGDALMIQVKMYKQLTSRNSFSSSGVIATLDSTCRLAVGSSCLKSSTTFFPTKGKTESIQHFLKQY